MNTDIQHPSGPTPTGAEIQNRFDFLQPTQAVTEIATHSVRPHQYFGLSSEPSRMTKKLTSASVDPSRVLFLFKLQEANAKLTISVGTACCTLGSICPLVPNIEEQQARKRNQRISQHTLRENRNYVRTRVLQVSQRLLWVRDQLATSCSERLCCPH